MTRMARQRATSCGAVFGSLDHNSSRGTSSVCIFTRASTVWPQVRCSTSRHSTIDDSSGARSGAAIISARRMTSSHDSPNWSRCLRVLATSPASVAMIPSAEMFSMAPSR